METVTQRLERLYNTDKWSQNDKEWLIEYLKGDISELYLIALDGFSKDVLEKKIMLHREESNQILNSIHQRIQPSKFGTPVRRLYFKLLVAASVGIVFCLGYLLRNQLGSSANPIKYESIVTLAGQLKLIQLADGTNIWLNADSRMTYPEKFAGKTREVKLSGEAYFEVAHDIAMPFIIHSGKVNTTVLGTSFNIKAYPDDKTIKVAVVTGKVGVTKKSATSNQTAVLLTPNKQAVFTDANGTLVSETIDASTIISWRQGKLQYRNAPLSEVLADVQRKYNVVIKADKNLLNCTLYADLNNLPLQKVLKLIGALINAHAVQDGSGYRFKGKGCS